MPLPSPPLPSLSAITHPTKVRWLLQEEGRKARRLRGRAATIPRNTTPTGGRGRKMYRMGSCKAEEGSNRGKHLGTFTMQNRGTKHYVVKSEYMAVSWQDRKKRFFRHIECHSASLNCHSMSLKFYLDTKLPLSAILSYDNESSNMRRGEGI